MNTQSPNQNDPANVELRLRTMRILWIALLMSIPIYFVFTFFLERRAEPAPNRTLSLALLIAGVSTTLISFLIKSTLLKKAAQQQQVTMVQQGYIVTWAITEVAALLGMLDFFATANPYCYVLFIIAALGMLLHFPKREAVLNATFKSQGF
jgi:hypothetical protein